jgi:hypothetical protein
MIDTLVRLTRPKIKKLLKLYMTSEFGSNNAFVKEACKLYDIKEDESHLVWQVFDTCYELWFLRRDE